MAAILGAILEICKLDENLIFWGTYIASIELGEPENIGVDTKFRETDASKVEVLQRLIKIAAILEICKLY